MASSSQPTSGTRHFPVHFTPRRALGKTGFVATRLGIGDVADRALPIEQCVATVRRAMDAGLNVIDTAPNYEEGYSEQIVGSALRESRQRDRMFLVTKIDHHDDPIAPQVQGSLSRLGLDHVDLFVFHGLSSIEGWHRVTQPGAGFDQLNEQRRAGNLRFRGISSHHPDVLKLAIESGLCDVVLFAIGAFVDERYVNEILPLAKRHNVGTICFKTFGAGKLLANTTGYNQPLVVRPRGKISSGGNSGGNAEDAIATLSRLTVDQCMRYTLTADPDVALLGMSFPNEQDAAFAATQSFVPMNADEMIATRAAAVEAIRHKGPCWWNPDPRNPSELS
jgi:1-deoxyxylulose-5-phosphate synthase